jgi:hypothetical protein
VCVYLDTAVLVIARLDIFPKLREDILCIPKILLLMQSQVDDHIYNNIRLCSPTIRTVLQFSAYSYTKSSTSERRHLFAWGFCEHGGIGIAKQLSKTSLKPAPTFIQRPLRMKLGDALLVRRSLQI